MKFESTDKKNNKKTKIRDIEVDFSKYNYIPEKMRLYLPPISSFDQAALKNIHNYYQFVEYVSSNRIIMDTIHKYSDNRKIIDNFRFTNIFISFIEENLNAYPEFIDAVHKINVNNEMYNFFIELVNNHSGEYYLSEISRMFLLDTATIQFQLKRALGEYYDTFLKKKSNNSMNFIINLCSELVNIIDEASENIRSSISCLTGHNKYSLSYKHSKLKGLDEYTFTNYDLLFSKAENNGRFSLEKTSSNNGYLSIDNNTGLPFITDIGFGEYILRDRFQRGIRSDLSNVWRGNFNIKCVTMNSIQKNLKFIRDNLTGIQQRQYFSPKQTLISIKNRDYYRNIFSYYDKNYPEMVYSKRIINIIQNYQNLGIKKVRYSLYFLIAEKNNNPYCLEKISHRDDNYIQNLVISHDGNRALLFMLGVQEQFAHNLNNLHLEIQQIHDIGHRILNILDELIPPEVFSEIYILLYPLRNEIYFPEENEVSFFERIENTIIPKETVIRDLGILTRSATGNEIFNDLIDLKLMTDYMQHLPRLIPEGIFDDENNRKYTINQLKNICPNEYQNLFKYVKSECVKQKVNSYAFKIVKDHLGAYRTAEQLFLKFLVDVNIEVRCNIESLCNYVEEIISEQKEIISLSILEYLYEFINEVNNIIPIKNSRGEFIKNDVDFVRLSSNFYQKINNLKDFLPTYQNTFNHLKSIKDNIPNLNENQFIKEFLSIKFIPEEIQYLYDNLESLTQTEIYNIMNALGIKEKSTLHNWVNYFVDILNQNQGYVYNINWFRETINITPNMVIQPPNFQGLKKQFMPF